MERKSRKPYSTPIQESRRTTMLRSSRTGDNMKSMHERSIKRNHQAVFVDKDGTLIRDIPYNVDPARISLNPGVVEGLALLQRHGYLVIIVTNQSGVAHGYFPIEAIQGVRLYLKTMLEKQGIRLDGFFFCPHHPAGRIARYRTECECRKPMPGLILKAAEKHGIDLSSSWMIGDILNDVEAGNRAGCKSILIDNGHETEWILSPLRKPAFVAADFKKAAAHITQAKQYAL